MNWYNCARIEPLLVQLIMTNPLITSQARIFSFSSLIQPTRNSIFVVFRSIEVASTLRISRNCLQRKKKGGGVENKKNPRTFCLIFTIDYIIILRNLPCVYFVMVKKKWELFGAPRKSFCSQILIINAHLIAKWRQS